MTLTTTDETQTPEVEPQEATPREPKRRPGLNTDTLALAGVFIAAFAFLAALFAVGLAARAIQENDDLQDSIGAGAPAGGSTDAATTVSLSEFAIDPDSLEVPTGSTLRIENVGNVTHNLSVDGVASDMINAGESGELDLSGLEPGNYTMRCDVPGHAEAGMEGTVTVQ